MQANNTFKLRDLARMLIPPPIWRQGAHLWRKSHLALGGNNMPSPYGWIGDYASWAEVAAQASGYDATQILARVEQAALKAKRGECVFERDASCHYVQFYNWPMLASLFYCTGQTGGHLRVLDFGGSLGSIYFQYRAEWRTLRSVEWSVVEQPHYVQAGKKNFETDTLRFYETVEEARGVRDADILLLSGVIDYIEKPYELLQFLSSRGYRWILLDRTGFSLEGRDRLTLQKVPSGIYDGSYPCWFLDMQRVRVNLAGYRLIWDFPSFDETGCSWPRPPSRFMGLLLEKDNT